MIILDNLLDAAALARIHALLAAGRWTDGAATAGAIARSVKCNLQLDASCDQAQQAGQLVIEALVADPRFMARALPARIHPPLFNRHGPGNAYGEHVDSALMALPAGAGMLRGDLSSTLFLSPPGSYDGGELQVTGSDGTVRTVKEQPGTLVLYASGAVHQVNPVTRGERQACVLWIQSAIRDTAARELLLELDECTQAVASQVGADDVLAMRMSALYHNLLRRWAQP